MRGEGRRGLVFRWRATIGSDSNSRLVQPTKGLERYQRPFKNCCDESIQSVVSCFLFILHPSSFRLSSCFSRECFGIENHRAVQSFDVARRTFIRLARSDGIIAIRPGAPNFLTLAFNFHRRWQVFFHCSVPFKFPRCS